MKTSTFISGWPLSLKPFKWLFMMMLTTTPGWAETNSPEDNQPDMELLEFLGEWEDEQGHWLDPLKLGQALLSEDLEDAEKESDQHD